MSSYPSSSLFLVLAFVALSTLVSTHEHLSVEAQPSTPPLVKGLSWTFYKSNCPDLETIIRTELKKVFEKDIGQAAGLLRLHFHDCFVQGCEASVLLDGSASGPSEKNAPPNLSLRHQAFKIINDLQSSVQKACGRVVSCADIVALAARDAVHLSGGPGYIVPLGRRDAVDFATTNETIQNLPAPTANTSALITALAAKNLTTMDLVALSGGHTIGIGNCTSFTSRLYPTQDSTLNTTFASNLKVTCPKADTANSTVLDIRSPNVFDNKYYVDLMNREGLFTSDQDLYTDERTRPIVTSFGMNQTLFFEKFVFSMIKMGQLNVLTGTQGQVRVNCSARNPTSSSYLSSVVDSEDNHEDVRSSAVY